MSPDTLVQRGQVLLAAYLDDVSDNTEDLSPNRVNIPDTVARPAKRLKQVWVHVDLYSFTYIRPRMNLAGKKIQVEISCGDDSVHSNEREFKHGFTDWFENIPVRYPKRGSCSWR